jgi:3-oxoacyl-[acyl-carrier protein] reductase
MPEPSRPVALVTGASRLAGIGAAVARALADAGHDLFITYYRPYDRQDGIPASDDEPARLLAELQEIGVQAAGIEIELADSAAPERVLAAAEAALGPVGVLVNNAAHSTRDGIDRLDAALLDRHYAVNVRAMALLCASFVRRYRATRDAHAFGRIINLSSGQGVGPMPGELAYAASKGAVEAFTVSLSAEVAPLNITVNAVDPGITDTGWIPEELHRQWRQDAPFGRVGTPADAARLIRFLASADAGWITGQVIRSRGGM